MNFGVKPRNIRKALEEATEVEGGGLQNEDERPPVLEPELLVAGSSTHFGAAGGSYSFEDGYYVNNGVFCQRERFGQIRPRGGQFKGGFSPSSADDSNVCCGLCGEIVPYDSLVTDHLPAFHAEVLRDGVVDLEEIPYETWLNERVQNEQFLSGVGPTLHIPTLCPQTLHLQPVRSTRQLRRISQYRVNTAEMGIPELELALQKKMVEKMGRKVPVTLVDKLHAKCGLCDTVISLNKKFEIVHLVRHFNAWHPSSHKCAGTWPERELPTPMGGKPLSAQDFAVIDPDIDAIDNLQCIWCGMFLSSKELGMHFHEVHPEEVEVPRCNLCLQELLINARLTEKFGEDFGVTLPSEHSYRSIRFKRDFKSDMALENAIMKYLRRIDDGADPTLVDVEDLDGESGTEDGEDDDGQLRGRTAGSCEAFANSRMNCGRRAKPKRQFIMPIVRQAAPKESQFVAAVTHSHWKCKLCHADIYAAVISAGVIKHFKKFHRTFLPTVQFELCKARLEKISDGKMEFVGENQKLIECSLCSQSFPVTPPFNICRAIRHIKMKHPEVMPEHRGGQSSRDGFLTHQDRQLNQCKESGGDSSVQEEMEEGVIYATEISEFAVLEMLRHNYSVAFDRVFSVYGSDIRQQIYILCGEGDELDGETVERIAKARDTTQDPMVVQLNSNNNNRTTGLNPNIASGIF
uniref:C2H2-type domain-containing protein n=1 Tax=Globodera rostochiensis TaxID=31243 RepID=A0A914HID9_GLORO